MISSNDLRPGLTIELDGDVWQVVEFLHVKPGKGAAFVRTKLKNMKTGYVQERTFRAGEKIDKAHIDYKEMQFLYKSDDHYCLMDMETFEQILLPEEKMGDKIKYLKENMVIDIAMYQGETIGIQLPNFVELEVVETDPSFKGDTATGGSKPAKLETGAVVQVPFFVKVGDIIRVDTRTDEYLERV